MQTKEAAPSGADGRTVASDNSVVHLEVVSPTLSYDPDASEYHPRLKLGHPYKTSTRFQRDDAGRFLRDSEGLQAVDDLMIKVAPNCFVNERSARALGFMGGNGDLRTVRCAVDGEVGGYLIPIPHELDKPFNKSTTPAKRAAGRERTAKKRTLERRAVTRMRHKFEKRQSIGDPDCPRSRDEDFPLLAVLRRDKLHHYIKIVVEYRRLVALCEAEPLKGQAYGGSEATGMAVAYVSRRMAGIEEVNEAAAVGFPGRSVPGGEIVYETKLRKSKGAYNIPAVRKKKVDVDAYFEGDNGTSKVGITESLHIKVTEDILLERIDRAPILARIRSALGPLLEPFDDAVLGGRTLQKIGNDAGFNGRDATSAGKALVLRGIGVADSFLGGAKFQPENDNYLIEYKKIA